MTRKTTLNTNIPGMVGYDKEQMTRDAKEMYKEFDWIFKG
jgi:hypothetical protein